MSTNGYPNCFFAGTTNTAYFNVPTGPTGAPGPAGSPGGTGGTGPTGPPGTPAPGVSPMTPFVEGVAYGSTDTSGRTQLGYGVDNSSTNVGLWSSSSGGAQSPFNSSVSVTAFTDTECSSARCREGIYLGDRGSIKGSTLDLSIMMQRNSIIENQADWSHNTMILTDFTANPSDSLTNSTAIVSGQFVTDTQIDQGILVGDMTGVSGNGVRDTLCIRTPGAPVSSTLELARDSAYIGNGQIAKVMASGEFLVETYNDYYIKTLAPGTGSETEYVTYDSGSGQVTTSPIPTPYVLPVKQPNVQGGQYGINSVANASEVNGRNSFNNYSAGPVALSGVTAVGQQLYQNSVPGTNNFTNNIFLGRSHQFTGAGLIQNSMIAATITGNVGISGISESCMIVPRASSLLLGYTGNCTGANFHSSGVVTCTSDPSYSSVLSSGGTVNPGVGNLVVCENQSGGSIVMSGSGNTFISSSSADVTYNWPAGINNSTVIKSGPNTVTPNAGTQLAVSHTSFLIPNLVAGAAGNAVYPATFNLGTGRISHVISADFSRILRRVGTTNASGQIAFSTGAITPLADSAISLTVRNASTTVSYNAQVISIVLNTITVQVFNSVTVVLASPSMTASGAGIIVHMMMSY